MNPIIKIFFHSTRRFSFDGIFYEHLDQVVDPLSLTTLCETVGDVIDIFHFDSIHHLIISFLVWYRCTKTLVVFLSLRRFLRVVEVMSVLLL